MHKPRQAISAYDLAALLGSPRRESDVAGRSAAGGPAYATLADGLRGLVLDGRLGVGVRLPAERALAAALCLSRTTVTAAYDQLRTSGHAVSRVGAGTWTAVPGTTPRLPAWLPEPPEPGVLDLSHAAPSGPPHLHAAYCCALDDLPHYLPSHGYVPQGLPDLRARIAERYTARGLPTTVEHITITAGALHGIRLACSLLVRRGDRVLTENPSYPNALDAVRELGARVIGLPIADGWDVGAFADAAQQTAPRVAYIQPDFQNPTGRLLEAETRTELARVLSRARCVAIVDETMTELALDDEPVPPPIAGALSEAVSVGSTSKIFWGGLRVGWLRASRELTANLATVRAVDDLGGPLLEQLAACHLLDQLDEVRAYRRAELRTQRDTLLGSLTRAAPTVRFRQPAGGIVAWCELPGPYATALARAVAPRGVRITPGPRFATDPALDRWVRLPYTQPPSVLEAAVEILGAELDILIAHGPRSPGRRSRVRARTRTTAVAPDTLLDELVV